MKLSPVALLIFGAAFTSLRAAPLDDFTADTLTHDGAVLRGKGHLQAKLASLLLTADEGSWNLETEELELSGHAKATLPARTDRYVIRSGTRALVSEEPIVISADRLRVKSDLLLRGGGHVQAGVRKTIVHADEIEVLLRIGDAEVRGNIVLTGEIPANWSVRKNLRPARMPAEIRNKLR